MGGADPSWRKLVFIKNIFCHQSKMKYWIYQSTFLSLRKLPIMSSTADWNPLGNVFYRSIFIVWLSASRYFEVGTSKESKLGCFFPSAGSGGTVNSAKVSSGDLQHIKLARWHLECMPPMYSSFAAYVTVNQLINWSQLESLVQEPHNLNCDVLASLYCVVFVLIR